MKPTTPTLEILADVLAAVYVALDGHFRQPTPTKFYAYIQADPAKRMFGYQLIGSFESREQALVFLIRNLDRRYPDGWICNDAGQFIHNKAVGAAPVLGYIADDANLQ